MDTTLAQARRQNDALKHSLRQLQAANVKGGKSGSFFDELRSDVNTIRTAHYSPAKQHETGDERQREERQREERQREERRREEKEKREERTVGEEEEIDKRHVARDARDVDQVDPRRDGQLGRGKNILLAKVEAQNERIEALESQVRRLTLQKQQLRDANAALHKRLQREPRTESRASAGAEPARAPQRAPESEARLRAENAELALECARLRRESSLHAQYNKQLAARARTLLHIYQHRAGEQRAQLRACLAVCALLQPQPAPADSTEQLLYGARHNGHAGDNTTEDLLYGPRAPATTPRMQLRARLLAVLFVARIKTCAAASARWRLLVEV